MRVYVIAGGEATWRNYLTLPNILKEFNPGLKGYSVGKGEFLAPNSHMNVAFPVSADFDAYRQAQFLVKKMKKDTNVDFKNDWKVSDLFNRCRPTDVGVDATNRDYTAIIWATCRLGYILGTLLVKKNKQNN